MAASRILAGTIYTTADIAPLVPAVNLSDVNDRTVFALISAVHSCRMSNSVNFVNSRKSRMAVFKR
jgi:hypothetical protein